MLSQAAITILGGKGGVGKTTLAAAYALGLARSGLRTLVVSTDPAHSLGDAFATPLGDSPQPIAEVERLWGVQPDPEATVQRRVRTILDDAQEALPREVMPAVRRQLHHAAAGPGMAESALTDRLIDLIERVPGDWDRLVVDSAPTGHLLRMLDLPSLLTPWVQGLARQRERAVSAERRASGPLTAGAGGAADATSADDPLLQRLHERRHRLSSAAGRLREDALVRLVLTPRRMVLAETERAAQHLREGGFHLGPVILNQIPPEGDSEVLTAVRERFADHGVVELAMAQAEPTGAQRLAALARELGVAQ
ncbi:ArsA family ATPase [Salinactinospora qingdaonensis]|uniref:ArsA family ATPase n=1 Tax=Salinactinospora qingdaonensis TaxID=702744 RepID=UPI0031F0D58B